MKSGGFRISALCAGMLVDIGGTCLATLLVAGVLAFGMASGANGVEEVGEALAAVFEGSQFMIGMTLVGCGFTVLGACMAARLAPHAPMQHALSLGLASLLIALWADPELFTSGFRDAVLALLTLPAAWLGGLLVRRGLKPPAVLTPAGG